MVKQIKQRINRSIGIIFLMGILLFALTSCKSPNGIDSNFIATITVTNLCGATVEIYMDDNLIFTIANGFEQVIDNIVKGSHLLEAFKAGTNMLVQMRPLTFLPATIIGGRFTVLPESL